MPCHQRHALATHLHLVPVADLAEVVYGGGGISGGGGRACWYGAPRCGVSCGVLVVLSGVVCGAVWRCGVYSVCGVFGWGGGGGAVSVSVCSCCFACGSCAGDMPTKPTQHLGTPSLACDGCQDHWPEQVVDGNRLNTLRAHGLNAALQGLQGLALGLPLLLRCLLVQPAKRQGVQRGALWTQTEPQGFLLNRILLAFLSNHPPPGKPWPLQ